MADNEDTEQGLTTRRPGGRGGRPTPQVNALNRPTLPPVNIPEDVSEFYANSLNVVLGPWDMTLLFGSTALPQALPREGQQATLQGEIRIDVAIRMSPQHAKAAVAVLTRMMEAYEANFGVVNIPEGVARALMLDAPAVQEPER